MPERFCGQYVNEFLSETRTRNSKFEEIRGMCRKDTTRMGPQLGWTVYLCFLYKVNAIDTPQSANCAKAKDEITFTKCQTNECHALPPLPMPLGWHRANREQVYLADDRTNQFAANLMHKGHMHRDFADIRPVLLSLMCFIIEFNAKIHVP